MLIDQVSLFEFAVTKSSTTDRTSHLLWLNCDRNIGTDIQQKKTISQYSEIGIVELRFHVQALYVFQHLVEFSRALTQAHNGHSDIGLFYKLLYEHSDVLVFSCRELIL